MRIAAMFEMGVEVGGGDLEPKEKQAGAARVNVVGGDAGEDLGERVLEGGAAGGSLELETVGAGVTLLHVDSGTAGVVVVSSRTFRGAGRGFRSGGRWPRCAGRSADPGAARCESYESVRCVRRLTAAWAPPGKSR